MQTLTYERLFELLRHEFACRVVLVASNAEFTREDEIPTAGEVLAILRYLEDEDRQVDDVIFVYGLKFPVQPSKLDSILRRLEIDQDDWDAVF